MPSDFFILFGNLIYILFIWIGLKQNVLKSDPIQRRIYYVTFRKTLSQAWLSY